MKKAVRNIMDAAQNASRWLWITRGDHTSYLDTSQGLIIPGWVTWARLNVVERPDGPRLHH